MKQDKIELEPSLETSETIPLPPKTLPMEKSKLLKKNHFENYIYQTGVSSWYGDDFHGRRTANGEVYNMSKLTAAHQTLPFNTLVEVTNLENNQRVLVRINDRGPFLKNRIIDLSYKAAKSIGIDRTGTANVSLKIVKPGISAEENLEYISNPSETLVNKFYIQAGAFSEKRNAEHMLKQIRQLIPVTEFNVFFKDSFYKIISATFSNKDKAEQLRLALKKNNIDAFVKEF
jgi:rare lipoprotein A